MASECVNFTLLSVRLSASVQPAGAQVYASGARTRLRCSRCTAAQIRLPVFSYFRPADQPADPFVSDPTRRLQPPLRLLKQIDPILLIRRGSILELRHQRHRKTETHSIPPVIVQLKRTGAGAEINPTSAHEQLHFKLRHTASSR